MRNRIAWLGLCLCVVGLAGCGGGKPMAEPTDADRALAAEVEQVAAAVRNTPAREAASRINGEGQGRSLKMLKSERPATAAQLAKARKDLRRYVEHLRRGPTWPDMPEVDVPMARSAPKIDGKLTDPAWAKAATFQGEYPFNQTKKSETSSTTWKILWDETYLYIAYDCTDTDIRAPKMPRDDHVYFHDCVEAFLLPEPRTMVYWELVVSPSGSIFDGLHLKQREKWGCIHGTEEDLQGLQVGTDIRGTVGNSEDTDEGYTVELAIPFGQLPEYSRTKPAAGHELHLMLVRLDKSAKAFKVYAFQPLMNWGHNIWNHVKVTLTR